ncbi:hypothetical protein ACLB2K_030774 [Fragaria x ananassa]
MQGLPPITCQSKREKRQREDQVLRPSTLRCLTEVTEPVEKREEANLQREKEERFARKFKFKFKVHTNSQEKKKTRKEREKETVSSGFDLARNSEKEFQGI